MALAIAGIDGCNGPSPASLPRTALGIDRLDDQRLERGRVEARRDPVVEHRRRVVQPLAPWSADLKICSSMSASPKPMYAEPSICPATSTGFSARPQSCAIQIFSTVTNPVSGSPRLRPRAP